MCHYLIINISKSFVTNSRRSKVIHSHKYCSLPNADKNDVDKKSQNTWFISNNMIQEFLSLFKTSQIHVIKLISWNTTNYCSIRKKQLVFTTWWRHYQGIKLKLYFQVFICSVIFLIFFLGAQYLFSMTLIMMFFSIRNNIK